MVFWFEKLEQLRKEQESETYRPMIQLELPVAPPEEPRSEKSESKRGVIIIGIDDEDDENTITI